METFTLTKRHYDSLITHYPEFMRTVWPKMSKQWALHTLTVTGTTEQIKQLRLLLVSYERILEILN